MSAEWAAVIIAVCGIVGTAFNIFIALSVKNSILGLKLWAHDRFVSKDDMSNYLAPIKESIQMVGSIRRMSGHDRGHEPPNMKQA